LRAIERLGPRDDLQALRQVLVGPDEVGRVIPEAMRAAMKRDPKVFGEILAPAIGTAVRTAVGDVIAAVLERINQMLEHAVSLRRLRWRLEARRTKKSLAEVALAHTVLYRLEWVVLLQSETGLVLEQSHLPEVSARVPDQLAAMLQAISTFVSEAFHAATPGGALETLEIGDLTVWLERDPAFTLAAAIRGAPPLEVRERLRTALAAVRTLHAEDVDVQIVDTARFVDTQPVLTECLHQELRPMPRRAQRILAVVGIVAVIAAGYGVARAIEASHTRSALARQDTALRVAYKGALEATPGIAVTSIDRIGGLYRVEGLRDPRAAEPASLVARAGLPPAALAFTPFDSPDARLGSPYAAAGAAIHTLEQIEFRYATSVAAVDASDPDIRRAAALILQAQRAAAHAGAGLCVEVIGEASPGGPSSLNEGLRAQRADHVIDALAAAGAPRASLEPRVDDRPNATEHQRRVTLRAVLRPDPQSPGCAG
jgi:OOP family OmpA-OmpF porin